MNIKLMVQQYIDLSISILLFMFFITYRRSSLNEKDVMWFERLVYSYVFFSSGWIPMGVMFQIMLLKSMGFQSNRLSCRK
jgi:hypothetical protein